MTQRWNPCDEGYPLYAAYCTETAALEAAGWEGEGLYMMTREAWEKWRDHRDHCENCRLEVTHAPD